jgi:predicted N-acyltransferase
VQLSVVDGLRGVAAGEWDALRGDDGDAPGVNPFVSHAFLSGLEQHGCLRPRLGWTPAHALLHDGARLVAAAPAYRKDNSHGEFVFDHAWAHAYARYGLDYYPKWLAAVPYSPVPGPRVLGVDARSRATLLAAMDEVVAPAGFSSLHFNFLDAAQLPLFDAGWLARADVQFHWRNDAGWRDFDDFLGALTSRKRKLVRAERAQVARAGVTLSCVAGSAATGEDLDAMHDFYCATQQDKGNRPALTRAFFGHLAAMAGDPLRLVLASRGDEAIAGALFLRGADTLYGRYWGASETVPGLHFEACYYQGIELALREGLRVFEPGAQGEHKIARGFLPVITHSRHRVVEPGFAEALAGWCAQERQSALHYRDAALAHSPFRQPGASGPLEGDDAAPAAPRG